MIELVGGGFLGAVFGGLLRIVPEALKFFDKKDERKHELKMFEKQAEVELARGEMKLAEIRESRNASTDGQVMDALNALIDQQTDFVRKSSRWVANFNALIRPGMLTYLLLMYGAVKFSMIVLMLKDGVSGYSAVIQNWTAEDMALLMGVVNYFILERTLQKRGL